MAQNWAIVVGINQYRFLQPLKYAKRDAETMQAFLAQSGFQRIFLFTDDSPEISGRTTEPFRNNLLRVLRQVFEKPFMKDGDNFWFFFSGHGIRHRQQDYLMPLDGDPEDVEHTGISTHLIADYLRSCGADNAVMILDACRSEGKKSGEGIGRQTEAEARQTGVISIFSCSPEQYSYEIEAIGQGAFTHALLEGLGIRGRCATVERLNQYLANRVPELVQQHLGRAKQIPYTIAEPIDRAHLILMPQHASLADIATLKNDAYRAQMEQDWERAERLWIRVLAAASGQDSESIKALQTIAVRRNVGIIPESSPPTQPPETLLPELRKGSEKVVSPTPESQPVSEQPKPTPLDIPASPLISESASLEDKAEFFKTQTNEPKQDSENISAESPETVSNLIPESQPISEPELTLLSEPPSVEEPGPDSPTITRQQFLKWVGPGGASLLMASTAIRLVKDTLFSSAQPNPVFLQSFVFEVVTVDEAGKEITRRPGQAEFFAEDLGDGIQLEMVKIPSGSFKMGSPSGYDDSPQHIVTVPPFLMGKFAVTQAQYQKIMGSNPSGFKGEQHPVEEVSWNNATKFCAKLSKQTGRTYRLPSEAEWEYACRAGTTTPFHFGETITSTLANYDANIMYQSEPIGEYRGQTTEVGKFPPNAFGLYDMHGNVWEWCEDYWHENYQKAPNDGSAWMSRNKSTNRVLRGGSWNVHSWFCKSASRNNAVPAYHFLDIGFRVVCVVRTL